MMTLKLQFCFVLTGINTMGFVGLIFPYACSGFQFQKPAVKKLALLNRSITQCKVREFNQHLHIFAKNMGVQLYLFPQAKMESCVIQKQPKIDLPGGSDCFPSKFLLTHLGPPVATLEIMSMNLELITHKDPKAVFGFLNFTGCGKNNYVDKITTNELQSTILLHPHNNAVLRFLNSKVQKDYAIFQIFHILQVAKLRCGLKFSSQCQVLSVILPNLQTTGQQTQLQLYRMEFTFFYLHISHSLRFSSSPISHNKPS